MFETLKKHFNYSRIVPFILIILLFTLLSCEKDASETEEVIRDVSLNQYFTMVPGETVWFMEPFEFRLKLIGFEDFVKQENTLANATAEFEYSISNGFGGLILSVAQDQGGEGPILFFPVAAHQP